VNKKEARKLTMKKEEEEEEEEEEKWGRLQMETVESLVDVLD